MSQIKFDKPLQIDLKPSASYLLYLKLAHGLALVVLMLPFNLDYGLRLLPGIFIIVSYFRSNIITERNYVSQLHWQNQEQWLWIANNKQRSLVFISGAIVTTKLLVLNFKLPMGNKISWCFLPDSGDEQLLRQLRVYLRYSTAETDSEIV